MTKIKPLEDKYIYDNSVTVPIVRPILGRWGNPLISLEIVPTYLKKGQVVRKMMIMVPHLYAEGKGEWRIFKVNTPTIEIGNLSRWNIISFCHQHKSTIIEFYPPDNATHIVLENINTSVGSSVRYIGHDGKLIKNW